MNPTIPILLALVTVLVVALAYTLTNPASVFVDCDPDRLPPGPPDATPLYRAAKKFTQEPTAPNLQQLRQAVSQYEGQL